MPDKMSNNAIRRIYPCLSVFIGGCIFLFCVSGYAEEWSRFRGDAQSSGVPNGSLPDELDVLWTAQVEIGIESTAAIWRDAVYVGGLDEKLYVFDF